MGLALVDSGACKTAMDIWVGLQYGLTAHRVVAENCGKFRVSGSGVEHDYSGVIEDSFGLRVGETGKFILSGL